MRAITSWSDEGFEIYGRKFLETWDLWVGLPLTIYTEGTVHTGRDCRNIWDIPGCIEFIREATADDNYRFNARKFARKAYAQMDALRAEDEIVCWFDGDIEFHKSLTDRDILTKIGPYLSVMKRQKLYPCSSFVAWNTGHPDHPKFMAEYDRLYNGRQLYREKEWHDAFILDVAIARTGVECKDLCEGMDRAVGAANVFDLVFPMGHHKKGPRKIGQKGG